MVVSKTIIENVVNYKLFIIIVTYFHHQKRRVVIKTTNILCQLELLEIHQNHSSTAISLNKSNKQNIVHVKRGICWSKIRIVNTFHFAKNKAFSRKSIIKIFEFCFYLCFCNETCFEYEFKSYLLPNLTFPLKTNYFNIANNQVNIYLIK